MKDNRLIAFKRLLDIMDDLREKCPWDRKQTIESIRHLTIEETYELSDAILEQDMEEIKKELGDLALHLVFYSKIASETNDFDITDVLNGICEKLIRRHPHIYGDVKADDAETVKKNWEQIKQAESKGEKSVLSGVPNSMPSLVKALRIQEKAAQVGFDWNKSEDVWNKVEEEIHELKTAPPEEKQGELGDVLFSIVNYARKEELNPDDALEATNKKFKERFQFIEAYAKSKNKDLRDMTLREMEDIWQKAKITKS
jgi:XTP/dITP diphosphohydrolase